MTPPADDTTPADTAAAEEAQAQADFDSGMPEPEPKGAKDAKPEPAAKPDAEVKPEPKAAVAAPKPAPVEYVRLTKDEHANLTAAAAKTASYDGQFAKAFGTIGSLQKSLTALQTAAPRTGKIEIPKDAFADMERDFPELAALYRKGLEATLAGVPTGAAIDPDLVKRLVTEHAAQARFEAVAAEIKELEADHPDWAVVVGKVDTTKGEKPDPNNAFRKWLATKSPAYQRRLNSTESAAVISDAIDLYKTETKAAVPTPPSLKDQLRTARIRENVQPRGDGGHATPASTDDAAFEQGFASR